VNEDTNGPTPEETTSQLPLEHTSESDEYKPSMRDEVPQKLNEGPDDDEFWVPANPDFCDLSAECKSSGATPSMLSSSPGHDSIPRSMSYIRSRLSCHDPNPRPPPMPSRSGYNCVQHNSPDMKEPIDPAAMSYRPSYSFQRPRPELILPPPSTYVNTKRERPDSVEPDSKRRKLSLPSHFDMEPLVIADTMESKGSDRDIVDVLLEQWTIPVY
jgi:hypothetical protein